MPPPGSASRRCRRSSRRLPTQSTPRPASGSDRFRSESRDSAGRNEERNIMRNTIVAAIAAVLVVAGVHDAAAQGRQRITGEGFISEGVPKMPDPPGPAPRRDLSGAGVGPQNNKPDPMPPMTPAGQAQFTLRKPYAPATGFGAPGAAPDPNDPFSTCDPPGFPPH